MSMTRASRLRGSLLRGILAGALLAGASGCQPFPSRATPPTVETGSNAAFTHVVDMQGQPFSERRLETNGEIGADFDVDISPQGDLVFSSTRFDRTPKILFRDSQGAVTQKTHGSQRDIQPKFSPDGQWIAFASDREGNFDILVIPTGSAGPCWQLTQSPRHEMHPSWSPDARRIAYCAQDGNGQWQLWIVDVWSRQQTHLGPGRNPEWSPTGDLLVFERRAGRATSWPGIWVVDVNGGPPRQVFTPGDHAAVQPNWSPNGQRLVFASARATSSSGQMQPSDLWVVDFPAGTPYRLTMDPSGDSAPVWGLDDRVYFTSQRSGSPRVWSLQVPEATLPGAPIRAPNDSPLDATLGPIPTP